MWFGKLCSGGLVRRLVVQSHQLLRLQRNRCVRPAVVVAELDLVNAGSPILYDGANLAADQSFSWQILKQRYYGKHFDVCHNKFFISYGT
jgi:hypothetical protein